VCTCGNIDAFCAWAGCAFPPNLDTDDCCDKHSYLDTGRPAYAYLGRDTTATF
jgi:hypothetical protein